jgi:hypothetical protein
MFFYWTFCFRGLAFFVAGCTVWVPFSNCTTLSCLMWANPVPYLDCTAMTYLQLSTYRSGTALSCLLWAIFVPYCFRHDISLQMVEHQMISSPKRKNSGHITNTISHFFNDVRLTMVAIFSLCWLLILLNHVQNGFSSISSHVFPIPAGFQLTLFPRVRWAGPSTPSCCRLVPGSSGSRQLPVFLSGTLLTVQPCSACC